MAKLKNYNGRYCESEYESAFIAFLQSVGWTYLPGNKIKRCYRDVLIADDFRAFITKANTDLLEEEIEQIYDTVRLVGAESDFATLHKVYKWMVDGIQFTPQSGLPIQVTLIDFETPENNIFHVVNQLTVGGTYFGATGCGKTYTMAFLARQLALRCSDIPEIGSPTIVMIVDRDELQEQGIKLFAKSKEFLNLGEVSIVKSRNNLRQELGSRESGGFYICTIQKFCDRKEDKIGLINDRHNIICFSDEAHRTQLEHSRKIQFSKDADENMKAMVSKPYAKVLKEAFPHATFVGFTGTPIAETYQTFGDEIDRYTMDQAVADGLTVSIKYHPRIAKVLLDTKKVKEIEAYYKTCADDGATEEDIEASKSYVSI